MAALLITYGVRRTGHAIIEGGSTDISPTRSTDLWLEGNGNQ